MPCAPCAKNRKKWVVRWDDGSSTYFSSEQAAQVALKSDSRNGKVFQL